MPSPEANGSAEAVETWEDFSALEVLDAVRVVFHQEGRQKLERELVWRRNNPNPDSVAPQVAEAE